MKPSKRIVAGIASAALVVGVGAGIADAAQKTSTPDAGSAAAGGPPPGRGGGGPASGAISTYLGLTAAELRTQLQAGKTLAAIATAQGKTVAGLEDAIVADAKTHLDADVTAGKLTAAQETTMLANLKSHVDDMVNGVALADGHGLGGPGGGHRGPGGGPFDLTAITDYLGLTAAQLHTQQEAGKSLAAIATAQGKTVTGLEDAIVAAATKKLDADVTAGKLTAAQETTIRADLKSHVDDMVNRTGPPEGGPRGNHGPPPGSSSGAGSGSIGSGTTTTTNRTIIR